MPFIKFFILIRFSCAIPDMTTSPTDTDTACSLESPAFLSPKCNLRLYDHHSSEEELEVINLTFGGNLMDNLTTTLSCSVTKSQDSSPKHTLNISPDEDASPRCSSTFLEKRKRSLAHNSDDEVSALRQKFCYKSLTNLSNSFR